MVFERYLGPVHIRCSCGKIKLIPPELFHLVAKVLYRPRAYDQIEIATGWKILFPPTPANKLVWLCPECWLEIREAANKISRMLYGLESFSLAQLTDKRLAEVNAAANQFSRETEKWRGNKCEECGAYHDHDDTVCRQCGHQIERKD